MMKNVKVIAACVLCAIGLMVIPSAAVVALDAARDPLDKLEQRTRQIPALHTAYLAPTDDAFAVQAARVETVVENVLGVEVKYTEINDLPFAGYTQMQPGAPRLVTIDSRLHWTARLEVLSHEAAHRLEPPVWSPNSSESEVFAESVSYLVCRKLGHDTLEISANYLAVHKGGLHVLKDYRLEINYAVAILTAGI
jgi:hypothetical protein